MKCLNDEQIQAVVDREASDSLRDHAGSCARCSERMREREALAAAAMQAINVPVSLPAGVSQRVRQALAEGSSQGATRLRAGAPVRSHRAWWSVAAVAAATLVAVVFVAPMVKGPATVSAAEILAKSATRLAERVTSGVESLEYELTLAGMTREIMPDHQNGTYRVRQVIDHETAGHYLVATYDPSGRLLSSIVQDPASHRRIMSVRLEDIPYRFEFTLPKNLTMSPPEMERLHMEASVAMMQASGNQQLQIIESASGRQYRIEVPHVSAETSGAVWDLAEAQVVIDAGDYHVVEFAVKGTFLKQPYSVSYRLIDRTVTDGAAVDPGLFAVPEDPRAITIAGDGTAVPVRDVLVATLGELARVTRDRR